MAQITPYRRHGPSSQPSSLYEPYRATVRRAAAKPLIFLPHTLSETTGPVYGHSGITETDNDLTRQHSGQLAPVEPLADIHPLRPTLDRPHLSAVRRQPRRTDRRRTGTAAEAAGPPVRQAVGACP